MSSTSRIAISSIATEDFSTWNIDPAHSAAEFKVRAAEVAPGTEESGKAICGACSNA